MNTFVIEDFFVSDDNACNFYMVRFDDEKVSKVDKFYDTYSVEGGEYDEDMQHITALIEVIAESGSSVIRRSRAEARALALPPKVLKSGIDIQVTGNQLRLYYIEPEENVIVLFGGGIAHDEPDGHPPIQLREAQIFAKKIFESIGIEFEIKNKRILPLEGDEIIIQ